MDMAYFDPKIETASRKDLDLHQKMRMKAMLREVLAPNPFHGKKLREAEFTDARDFASPADLVWLPFTRKQELLEDQ